MILPKTAAYGTHVFHIYAVRVANRDPILSEMGNRGVSCGIHYPIPVHLQDAYKHLGLGKGSFPVAEQCAAEFLSLPMYPELSAGQVEYTASQLKECLADRGASVLVAAQ